MYTSVRTYRIQEGTIDDMLHQVDTGFADQIAAEDGFVGYQVLACEDGTLMTVSTFHDREQAMRSNELAAAWVRENLPDMGIERISAILGEVGVSRAAAQILEAAHH